MKKTQLQELLENKPLNGFSHCHARGVYSLLLTKTERVFFAFEGHELWKNHFSGRYKFSVGFHNHSTDIELALLFGFIRNEEAIRYRYDPNHKLKTLTGYEFDSKLAGGKGGFMLPSLPQYAIYDDDLNILRPKIELNEHDQRLFLKSQDLHTIYVPRGMASAWIVKEFPDTKSDAPKLCYSNHDLTQWSPEGYYCPMDSGSISCIMAVLRERTQEFLE